MKCRPAIAFAGSDDATDGPSSYLHATTFKPNKFRLIGQSEASFIVGETVPDCFRIPDSYRCLGGLRDNSDESPAEGDLSACFNDKALSRSFGYFKGCDFVSQIASRPAFA